MLHQNKFKSFVILGVRVDAVTMRQAIDAIVSEAKNPKSPACYVTKPYVEFLDRAADDPDAKRLLNESALSLPDGVALQWAAAVLHGGRKPSLLRFWGLAASIVLLPAMIRRPLPEKFSGITFAWPMLEAARDAHLRILLIGTPKGRTIQDTKQKIEEVLPGITIVDALPGEVDGLSGKELFNHLKKRPPSKDYLQKVRAAKADLILVGMGFPLQEQLMAHFVKELPHGVCVGEGGTFDYASFGGVMHRAPRVFQALGLEWFWRLVREPSRWKRQLAIPRFMTRVYKAMSHS